MSDMQHASWGEILTNPDFTPHQGQARAFDLALGGNRTQIVCSLPTGYGKTIALLGCYAILRYRGVVNRMLVLVPSDLLRRQYAKSRDAETQELCGLVKDAATLGIQLKSVAGHSVMTLEDPTAAFCHHRDGTTEVFVATYQQVARESQTWIDELTQDGDWLIGYDEFHRAADDQAWGKASARLMKRKRCRYTIFLSATPERNDGKVTIAGVDYQADPKVSWADAHREHVIRTPDGRNNHYFVDVMVKGRDNPDRITTDSLKRDGASDYQTYEQRKQLRYIGKYISHMLAEAYSCLLAKNMTQPNEHQMLVFAMSQKHADAVVKQLNAIAEPGFADWIGMDRIAESGRTMTTQSEKKNEEILNRFNRNQLKCLVTIDKVTEGFDNPRCSVLVFLHLISSPPKLAQQIGRGLRRNKNIENFDDDICHVFSSADSPIAGLIDAFLSDIHGKGTGELRGKCVCCEHCPICVHHFGEIPEVDVLTAWFDKTTYHGPSREDGSVDEEEWREVALKYGAPKNLDVKWFARFMREFTITAQPSKTEELQFESAKARLTYFRQACDSAVGTYAALIARLLADGGSVGFDKSWIGDVKKRVNAEWLRQDGEKCSTVEDYKRKHDWVREEHGLLLRREIDIPQWARLW